MNGIKLNVYESIVERIKRDIALGIIAADEKLPSCRDLALTMGVNPNTVQRAYSTLEEQGVIYTIPKKGAYAASTISASVEAEKGVRALKAAGVSKASLMAAIEKIYSEENS